MRNAPTIMKGRNRCANNMFREIPWPSGLYTQRGIGPHLVLCLRHRSNQIRGGEHRVLDYIEGDLQTLRKPRKFVTINRMQSGYRYELVAHMGRDYHPGFRPEHDRYEK